MDYRTDEYAGDDDSAFKQWMREVDSEVSRIAGISVMDLSDQPFRDQFEDGIPAEVAAADALEDNGYDMLVNFDEGE